MQVACRKFIRRFCVIMRPVRVFLGGTQFSCKLARLHEYSYLDPVLYLNIHIAHDTKCLSLQEKKKKAMKYPFPVPSPNPNYNTKSEPLHHKQLRKTMHTILPNVCVSRILSIAIAYEYL